MTRPSVRTAGALAGLALLGGLAGCTAVAADTAGESTAESSTSASGSSSGTSSTTSTAAAEATGTSGYADGAYTATGTYSTPGGSEAITVTVTLADGVVTDLVVTGDADSGDSARYQEAFIGGISDLVVGKSLDEIDVDVVSGSSLTSAGFDDAIATIAADALA